MLMVFSYEMSLILFFLNCFLYQYTVAGIPVTAPCPVSIGLIFHVAPLETALSRMSK